MFGEAEWWILDRNSGGPFTFQEICEALGIEPDRLRHGLHQWRVQQSGGMSPRRLGRRGPVRSVGPIARYSARKGRTRQYGSDKRSLLGANVHSPGVILVIFDPSRPMPPIRPFWLKTTAYTSERKFVVVSDRAAPWSSTTILGPVPIAQPPLLSR